MVRGAVVSNQASVRPMVGQACRTSAAPLSGVNVPGFGMYEAEAAVPAMSTDVHPGRQRGRLTP